MVKGLNDLKQLISRKSISHFPELLNIQNSLCQSVRLWHHLDQKQVTEVIQQVLHALVSAFPLLHHCFNRLKHSAYIIVKNRTGKLSELSGGNPPRHIQHLLVRHVTVCKGSNLIQNTYRVTHATVRQFGNIRDRFIIRINAFLLTD
ncbi:hypothetical protein D3C74_339390 [compost metagenome]